ncbi:Ragulator complex protein LAMTOR2-like protein, partial [Fragariocoptes setiger]
MWAAHSEIGPGKPLSASDIWRGSVNSSQRLEWFKKRASSKPSENEPKTRSRQQTDSHKMLPFPKCTSDHFDLFQIFQIFLALSSKSSDLPMQQTVNVSNGHGSLANMLRPKTLNSILSRANTGGVICTLLLNKEGTLLAYAGGSDEEARTTAALASTIWKNFERYGNSAFHDDRLKCTVVQCHNANLVIRNLSTVLLCIFANQDAPIGMLKNKAKCLADHIEAPLDKILRT